MEVKDLVGARKKAEAAVVGMVDGPLKVSAFETILRSLLDEGREKDRPAQAIPQAEPAIPRMMGRGDAPPTGTSSRIMSMVHDNFFAVQRSLAEIQAGLAERGWHYDQNFLSTPLARLVRRKLLRRTQAIDGPKKLWKYSIY